MLTTKDKSVVAPATASTASSAAPSAAWRSRLAMARSVKWLGQTAASLCWIGSMLISGIESGGDWLQLCAASAWLLANIAALLTADTDRHVDHAERVPETRVLK